MIAGKLDRRVTLWRRGPVQDDGYGSTQIMEPIATRWAAVIPQTGREVIEAGGKDGERVSRFHFRYDSVTATISETDELAHDGARYAVTGPTIEIGRREGIEVLAASIGDV